MPLFHCAFVTVLSLEPAIVGGRQFRWSSRRTELAQGRNDVVATARKDADQTAADTPHRSEETLAPMEPGAEGPLGSLWLS